MAGLNDDVDEGLDDIEDVNFDVTIAPNTNPNQPEPESVVLVSQTTDSENDDIKEPTIQELFGETVIPGELPNFNAEFVIIANKQNILNDYISTSVEINKKQTISQEDARILDSLAPGFLNDETKPIGYFTKTNTKTFYDETVKEMNNHVINEKTNINKDLIKHIENISTSYYNLLTIYETKYKTILVEQNIFIKRIFFDVLLNNKMF